ncbi:hypothetical protein [Paenibacillus polymyxa]|uniref:hypothetical protein n=1 Tax=Paenibacillus polymyxa TaxID=1406 RepID=UPI002ED6BC4B
MIHELRNEVASILNCKKGDSARHLPCSSYLHFLLKNIVPTQVVGERSGQNCSEEAERSPLSPDFHLFIPIPMKKSGDNSDRKNNLHAQRLSWEALCF